MGLIGRRHAKNPETEAKNECWKDDELPLLRWFLIGGDDTEETVDGDTETVERSPGSIGISLVSGRIDALRIVLRDPSSGCVAFLNYQGPTEDLLRFVDERMREKSIDWTVDKFAKRR